jgi:archaellum biogenesis ATPase FlaH
MVNPHLEKIFFHNIIRNQHYIEVANPRFFEESSIKQLFPVIKEFWNRYKECPTLAQVREIVKVKGLEEEVTSAHLERMWEIDMNEYDDEWLRENTETFIEYKNLEVSTVDLVSYLQTSQVNTENIKNIVQNAKNIILDRNNIDFEFSEGSDFFNPATHRQPTYNTFSSGYPFIDLITDGGFSAKTLTVLLGQAKVGKSIWLANLAAKAVQAGHNVAVITMEMAEELYIKRMGSNMLSIPVREYKSAAEDQEMIKKKLSQLGFDTLRMPGQLLVKEFPTSTASSLDIEAYLRRVEQRRKIKFKVVIIDYINIMKNWRNPNTENTYMKIKQIAEDVRAMAISNEWAVISATQVKQGFFDMNDMSIGAASESSGLVATVDLMFGIIQDPLMYAASKYKLKVLANRGEGYKNAAKTFDVNYNFMRISEDSQPISEGKDV